MSNIFSILSEEEIDLLNNFMLDRIDDDADTQGKDEGVLDISELDGLMTAIISGPILIQPSQWFPAVWGDFEPEWTDDKEVEAIMTLMIRHMNSIVSILMEQPDNFEPIYLQREVKGKTYLIVDEWCEGYMRGVALAKDHWGVDELEMKILLAPIKAFAGDDALITHKKFKHLEIENIQKAITPNAIAIHGYWLNRRSDDSDSTVVRKEPRVGRNDPCSCGSGKKYKKCCLN